MPKPDLHGLPPAPAPVRPPTLRPDFRDIRQSPGFELRPTDPSSSSIKILRARWRFRLNVNRLELLSQARTKPCKRRRSFAGRMARYGIRRILKAGPLAKSEQ